MSAGVLFDHPGPRTVARHRLYSVLGAVLLAAIVALAIWRLYENDQLVYAKWEPFLTPRYMEAILVDGLLETLKMAFSAVLLALALGVMLGTGKLSDHAVVRWPCWVVVEFFRAVPVALLMVFIYYFWGIKQETGGSYWSVVIALTLYNGAVLAEIFRAGVNAVPRGQSEAAYALGMRKSQVMNIVLLPQAVKIMIPAIISQCVVALKDTSLGYLVVAPGLTFIGKSIWNEFGNHVPAMMVIASLYIGCNLVLTALAYWAQKRFVGEKKLEVPMVGEAEQKAT